MYPRPSPPFVSLFTDPDRVLSLVQYNTKETPIMRVISPHALPYRAASTQTDCAARI